MDRKFSSVRVAVVQAAPVLFDREATVEKACRLIREAAAQDVQLVLFPEAFIPAYPRGLSFGMVVGARSPEGRRTWQTSQAEADRGRALDLGRGRWQYVDSAGNGVRESRWAHLLGKLHALGTDGDVRHARPDVFQLIVNELSALPVTMKQEGNPA